jgi:CelD/BcsL family acetyltransferase involved in cellulose biosynthesis
MDLVASLDEVDGVPARRLRGGRTVSIFTSTRAAVEMLADMLNQEGIPSIVKPASTSLATEVGAPSQSPLAELHMLERDANAQRELIQELIDEITGEEPEAQLLT